MSNFINAVCLGLSETGKYRIIVEYSDDKRLLTSIAKKTYKILNISCTNVEKNVQVFDFENINKANLFVGFCVYPFINQNLGIFQNTMATRHAYFFDKNKKKNIEDGKNFFDFGNDFILHKQRRNMVRQLVKKHILDKQK